VSAALGPFQLDDDEVGTLVYSEQIDAARALLPVAEFLAEDVEALVDRVDLIAKIPLQIATLAQAEGCESGVVKSLEFAPLLRKVPWPTPFITDWLSPGGRKLVRWSRAQKKMLRTTVVTAVKQADRTRRRTPVPCAIG
jgi:hypothetical protein